MPIPKETLMDFKEKYEKTEKLVNESSKLDPPNEPFKSHYEARAILLELNKSIKGAIEQSDQSDDTLAYKFILAHVIVDLGKIYNFTEEWSTAEKYLNESIDLLGEYNTKPSAICAYVNALNEIGIIWTNRGDAEKAKDFLVKAETAYNDFKAGDSKPLLLHDLFDGNNDGSEKGAKALEKINVLTLFYLAQVFGSLGDLEKSAIYCHTTLKKQLLSGDFESIDWALNAATLSQYFCTNNRYTEARHHLAAATYILYEYQQNMIKPGMTDDEKKSTEENFNHRLADVHRCWIKYGLNLMSDSRDRLLEDSEDGLNQLKIHDVLTFGTKVDPAFENVITDRYLLDADDARPVFLKVIDWAEKAKSYYTPETEATEYSKIIQDWAMSYKHLAFFESDPSNQAKMHKRRIDLLEDLNELLNKVFYMNIVREILYELGTAYSNILDIKLEAFEQSQANNVVNPHAMKKINDLITKSRNHFKDFISTYFLAKTETLKPDLAADELIPIAFSHFQIARISYKFITPDKHLQIMNLTMCLENYRKFIALCAQHKEVGEKMKAEVSVSKEMAELLPIKIARLKENLQDAPPVAAITAN